MKRTVIKNHIFRFTIYSLAAALFVGCVTIADKVISDPDMNEMGVKAFDEIKAKTPIEYNAATNAYVKCVANAIIAALPREGDGSYATGVKSWEIVVFQDNTANAFALPGGKIGVHTGLLKVATTQGQLAAVLGHEVGHVLAKHGKQRVVQSQGIGMFAAYIGPLLGSTIDLDKETVDTAIGMGAQYGVMLPFSRGHESEADTIGQDLMAQAGFDPTESIKLWQNMSAAGGSGTPEFMSTHPSASTRISDLQKGLEKSLPTYQLAKSQGKNPRCN
ncbi:MAG: M48 family metallopeptidase [Leptospiraceae bacterium]|nr:M48 family metallopeptidase [Leptospiraceae bacterium]